MGIVYTVALFTRKLNPEHFIRRALIKAQAGKIAQAEKLLRRALAERPDDVQTLVLLGDLLAGEHRLAEAQDSYQAACALNQTNAGVLYRIGMTLGARRRYEDALIWYERAIANLGPEDNTLKADCWLNFGVAQWQVRLYNRAFTSWEKALHYDPALEKAKYFLEEFSNDYGQPAQKNHALNDIAAFRKIKMQQYFAQRDGAVFRTQEEAAGVLSAISQAWVDLPGKDRLSELTAAEKLRIFKDMPLDRSAT